MRFREWHVDCHWETPQPESSWVLPGASMKIATPVHECANDFVVLETAKWLLRTSPVGQ